MLAMRPPFARPLPEPEAWGEFALPSRPERPTGSRGTALLGRPFVHPLYDLLLIAGGASLAFTAAVWAGGGQLAFFPAAALPWIVLVSNSAHFAASTVRLYSKPGATAAMPFTSAVLPVLMLVAFALVLDTTPRTLALLDALYLGWSPYHYGAQAYGIGTIYAWRSGRRLSDGERRVFWWTAQVPFVYMLIRLATKWEPALAQGGWLPSIARPLGGVGVPLLIAAVLGPLVWAAALWRMDRSVPPLLAVLPLLSNAVWFFVLDPLDAFLWATIFHGIQYLALVVLFHARDHAGTGARPGVDWGLALRFYAVSLVLGWVLFICVPVLGTWLGAPYVDSRLAAVALVNIHHFLVDARIWRLRGADSNRKMVEGVVAPGLGGTLQPGAGR